MIFISMSIKGLLQINWYKAIDIRIKIKIKMTQIIYILSKLKLILFS